MNWTHRRINDHLMEYSNDTNNITIMRNDEEWSCGLPRFIVTINGIYIRGCEVLEPLKDFVSEFFGEYGIYSVSNYCIYLSRFQMA